MTISPSTDLYLLKLPIELNDENQLTFASASAQATYFLSLPKIGDPNFSYQRRDSVIRYPAHIDSIIQYNYVMYKNENYSNKWFYARIMNMEYVNDGMTLISIDEDAFQTWQFDLGYSQCFVEREHVNDDTVGAHTVPENLECGPPSCIGVAHYYPDNSFKLADQTTATFLTISNMIIFQVSAWVPDLTPSHWYPQYANSFSGLGFFGVKDVTDAVKVCLAYQAYHGDDEIVSIFMAPPIMFKGGYKETKTITIGGQSTTVEIWSPAEVSTMIDMNTTLYSETLPATLAGSYTPKNNKLFCWPYNYMVMTNMVGDMQEYHWEDFTNNNPRFNLYGVLSQGCSIKCIPKAFKYNDAANTYCTEYAVNARKYPICAWSSDAYTNWLTQNSVNAAVGVGTSLVGGLASGGLAGGVLSGAIAVANTIGQAVQATKLPDRAKGDVATGDFAQATYELFQLYKYTIRPEYAKIIDDYFSCYGYKVNEVKLPNITGRTNWNYVKTIGSAIHADIPQDSCDRINRMFDNGITFWHNPSTFRDYTQSNTIVTP